jgi:hypothetical protein
MLTVNVLLLELPVVPLLGLTDNQVPPEADAEKLTADPSLLDTVKACVPGIVLLPL